MLRSMRRGFVVVMVAASLAGLLPTGARGDEVAPGHSVKIGLPSSLFRDTPAPMVQMVMKPFRSLMESQTGLSGTLIPGILPEEMGQHLREDKVQLAVYHGFEYAWARQKFPDLKPLMIAVNQQRHLRAYVLVNKESAATALADLKGKNLAMARRTREHCHLFLERRCLIRGGAAADFFGRILTPNSADDAIDAVVSSQVGAALVDGVALAMYREAKPGRAERLRVLEQSESFPAAVVVYRSTALDEATLRRFREGMIGAKDNPRGQQLMSLVQITSFEPIPEDYDRMLTDIAKAYPLQERGKKEVAVDLTAPLRMP